MFPRIEVTFPEVVNEQMNVGRRSESRRDQFKSYGLMSLCRSLARHGYLLNLCANEMSSEAGNELFIFSSVPICLCITVGSSGRFPFSIHKMRSWLSDRCEGAAEERESEKKSRLGAAQSSFLIFSGCCDWHGCPHQADEFLVKSLSKKLIL